jgi:hypothetical protein
MKNIDKKNKHIPKLDGKCGKGFCSTGHENDYVGFHTKSGTWLCLGCMDEEDEQSKDLDGNIK